LCFGWFDLDGAVRIGLRNNPVLRDRLFYGVLAGAFAHGAYLMYVFLLSPHARAPLYVPLFLLDGRLFCWNISDAANSGTAYSLKEKLWLSLFVLGW